MGRMFQASVFFVAWWWGAWLCVGGVWGIGGGRVVILVLNWVRAVFPCDYRSVVRQLVSQLVHVYN